MAFIAAQQIMIQRTTFISNAPPSCIVHLPFYFLDDSRTPTAPERRDLVSYGACRQSVANRTTVSLPTSCGRTSGKTHKAVMPIRLVKRRDVS